MCGIAGFVGAGGREDIERMTTALTHRGPDGEGFFDDASHGLHLGFRRLAVLDLAGGNQPMWNEDHRVCVVHNGEIYNHAVLRAELEAQGHRFRSDHSDTEVLVHGWEQWGERLPERLNGMFAFAVVDLHRKSLFLARDRFGEKPLYWFRRAGAFAFASELGALAKHPAFPHQLDRASLQKYFAWGYVPAPRTPYASVEKLMPGGYLDIDLRGVEVRAGRYWSFRLAPDPALDSADEGALVEELRSLLSEATRLRLEADVPLGFFLSGGIDSSALLALATRHVSPERLQAFTIGFNETSFDESAWAAAAARAAGVRHAVEVLDFSTAAALVPEVLGRLDEPLADASIVPTYLLSRFARRSVTVALSGDGGDELFAGYDPFRALAPASLYRRLVPKPLHKLLRRLADVLPLSEQNMSLDFKLRRALAGAGFAPPLWNPVWMAPAEPDLIAELFEEPLRAEDLYAEAIDQWESSDPRLDLVDRTLEFYANFYLPNDILMKLDRASMMVSLESRTVFLDNDVVAFCQRLPNRFKFRHGMGKYLLRKALAPLVPKDILRRPKKGFGIPAAAWLRQWNPPDGARLAPHVKLDVLHRLWQEHRARKRDHRLLLWAWLSADAALAPPTAAEKFAISAMP